MRPGFTRLYDRLTAFLREKKLSPLDVVFNVPDEQLDQVFNFSQRRGHSTESELGQLPETLKPGSLLRLRKDRKSRKVSEHE